MPGPRHHHAPRRGFLSAIGSAGAGTIAPKSCRQDPEATRVYLPAPKPGEIHRQPDLARTFRAVAEGGAEAFYHGPLAEKIAACVQSKGGYLTAGDLAAHTATWEKPIRTTYRDVEVLEHPPNGQGLAALVALNIVEGYDIGSMSYYDPERWHLMIEAMRIGHGRRRTLRGRPGHGRCAAGQTSVQGVRCPAPGPHPARPHAGASRPGAA